MSKLKTKRRAIAELQAAEYNPRQLSEKQASDLRESLEKFGLLDPIIINVHPDRRNVVIGGHQRMAIWSAMGNTHVPVVELSMPLEQERELNIRLNRNTGEWDMVALQAIAPEKLVEWGWESWEMGDVSPEQDETSQQAMGETAKERYEKFRDSEQRGLGFFFDEDEYRDVMRRLAALAERRGLETTAEAVLFLIRSEAEHHANH